MIATLKIGTQIYSVHKTYVDGKLQNGKVIVGKIKSYQNVKGKIHPIIKEVGAPRLIDIDMHYLYTTIEQAVEAITTEKAIKGKKKKL